MVEHPAVNRKVESSILSPPALKQGNHEPLDLD
jgi:hypothetical protein